MADGQRLVFVSHSGMDTWVAKQIARAISDSGAVPFLDEAEIDVGADFEEDILAFLQKADRLVVLLTPWALERPYVWAELGAAWGRQIPIVGLLHGLTVAELQSRASIPILLKRRDLLPLNQIDTYLEQLRGRVRNESRRNIEEQPWVGRMSSFLMASLTRYSKGYKIRYRVYYSDGADRLAFAYRYCFRRDALAWFPLLPGRRSVGYPPLHPPTILQIIS